MQPWRRCLCFWRHLWQWTVIALACLNSPSLRSLENKSLRKVEGKFFFLIFPSLLFFLKKSVVFLFLISLQKHPHTKYFRTMEIKLTFKNSSVFIVLSRCGVQKQHLFICAHHKSLLPLLGMKISTLSYLNASVACYFQVTIIEYWFSYTAC